MNCAARHLLQDPGSCWLISNINLFIVSDIGRSILQKAVYKYIIEELTSNVSRRNFKSNATPKHPFCTKEFSKFNFFRYLYFILKTNSRVRAPGIHLAKNIIKTVRNRPIETVGGGSITTIEEFLTRLKINYQSFGLGAITPNMSRNSDVVLVDNRSRIFRTVTTTSNYSLAGVSITLNWVNGKGHSICGVICRGKYFIADSEIESLIPCDWRVNSNIFSVMNTIYPNRIKDILYSFQIYFKSNMANIKSINNINRIFLQNTKTNNLSSEITKAAILWENYKDSFINGNDPTAVLRASFLISYMLFKIEFKALPASAYMMYNSKNIVERNIGKIKNIAEGQNAHKMPGFDYKGSWSQPEPFFTNKSKGFAAMMLLRKGQYAKLIKNGVYVDVDSSEYKNAENEMVAQVQSIAENRNITGALNRNYRNAFKYTYYGPESKFINSFFYHSMAMFGWWAFYGFRYSRTARKWVATEHPGSCNVAGLINMYLFKKHNKLNNLVYIAHGATSVSRASAINSMTAQRAQGGDEVQFCHHGWQVAGEKPLGMAGATTSNMVNYRMRWRQRTLYSHSDAFDVLTLSPIFRSFYRIKRQGRDSRAKVVDEFLKIINTRVRNFISSHILSNLPLGPQNVAVEMKKTNIIPKRNQNGLNLSALNNSKPNFSKYRSMINNIRNKNMNIVTAKATYPEFFKNIQNKNVLEMIKGMKNTNTNNIQAHLPRPGPNNNSALNKIAYRIRTLMNRR